MHRLAKQENVNEGVSICMRFPRSYRSDRELGFVLLASSFVLIVVRDAPLMELFELVSSISLFGHALHIICVNFSLLVSHSLAVILIFIFSR